MVPPPWRAVTMGETEVVFAFETNQDCRSTVMSTNAAGASPPRAILLRELYSGIEWIPRGWRWWQPGAASALAAAATSSSLYEKRPRVGSNETKSRWAARHE